MSKVFECSCDMGSMKIMFRGGSCFFDNEVGDIDFRVKILKKDHTYLNSKYKFKGHFTVFEKAWLMWYDCDNENKVYEFTKGRYFVYLDTRRTIFYITKIDEDIHA